MAHDARDNPSAAFTVTNFDENLAIDASSNTLSGQFVASMVNELQKLGILKGTTSA